MSASLLSAHYKIINERNTFKPQIATLNIDQFESDNNSSEVIVKRSVLPTDKH